MVYRKRLLNVLQKTELINTLAAWEQDTDICQVAWMQCCWLSENAQWLHRKGHPEENQDRWPCVDEGVLEGQCEKDHSGYV